MDEYDKKFNEMQKYIPFLEAMIERLQNVKDKSREVQLQKMQSLHGILSNSKRKLRIETLQRCEDVLQKLHNKVEKGNTPGLQFPGKRVEGNATQSSTLTEDVKASKRSEISERLDRLDRDERVDRGRAELANQILLEKKMDETPASPSPPVSPDSGTQSTPIIIPTERSLDFIDDKSSSKPASPDQTEIVPIKEPIIIPTERRASISSPPPKFPGSKDADEFSEWDLLEESERQNVGNKAKSSWQPVVATGHDVAKAAKLIGNSLPQKLPDGRMHVPRHIPTVPVPSLGGSRRLSSVLEKNRLTGLNVDVHARAASPPICAPEARLKSPEPDILFPKGKNISPMSKEAHTSPKVIPKTTAPLLVSPPPVSTEPPLSIEDLAELLNEEDDKKVEKKSDKAPETSGEQSRKCWEKLEERKKDVKEPTVASALGHVLGKDVKVPKNFLLSQEDIDRESERRWEEIDKHIVKLTTRKCLPTMASTSPIRTKPEPMKPTDGKAIPILTTTVIAPTSSSPSVEKPPEFRNRPTSPSKMEPRYADNYERHPRQRDSFQDYVKDKPIPTICRLEEDMSSPHGPKDEKGLVYPRRPPDIPPLRIEADRDFRLDNPDYFNRQIPNPHWSPSVHQVSPNEFSGNQWAPPPSNYNIPNSPHPPGPPMPPLPSGPNLYPPPHRHVMPEMWGGPNSMPIDPHANDGPMRQNQYAPPLPPQPMNAGIQPLMSPTPRQPDMNHMARDGIRDSIREGIRDGIRDDVPGNGGGGGGMVIPPLMSPTGFSMGPQYRSFSNTDARSYEPPFDRGNDYSGRQSWDHPQSRTPDWTEDIQCGIMNTDPVPVVPPVPYPRPSTPGSWSRDRDRCNRGRGRDSYYNERNRMSEIRPSFGREIRRPEWHSDWDSGRGFRDRISDRDPRVSHSRLEHGNSNMSRDGGAGASARDPRLAKDKHQGKSKESFDSRDPRKRPPMSGGQASRKNKDKQKKSSESNRRDSEGKQQSEKASKDKMQSPLESLYGVIDTKAKTGPGYGLQKFKIPKIKRAEAVKAAAANEKSEAAEKKSLKEEANAEVTSSSDGHRFEENWDEDDPVVTDLPQKRKDSASAKESSSVASPTVAEVTSPSTAEDGGELKFGEADSLTNIVLKSAESDSKKDGDHAEESLKLKDEVTQEWIETLIRKSLEFGEGKKLFEHAKLIQKLGEALQAKKLKKIKKIIESGSSSSANSSGSEKEDVEEPRKVFTRKKRRVIVSDSSDEECLAERLGILGGTTKKEDTVTVKDEEKQSEDVTASTHDAAGKDSSPKQGASASRKKVKNIKQEKSVDSQNIEDEDAGNTEDSFAEDKKKLLADEAMTSSAKKKARDADNDFKVDNILSELDTSASGSEVPKQEAEDDKDIVRAPKAKAKRRNSLEMLQEDIREMFISEGVVTATGYRMCRLLKENQPTTSTFPSNSTSTPLDKSERTDKLNKAGKGEKLDMSAEMDKSDLSDPPNTFHKLDTSDKTDKPDKSNISSKTDSSCKFDTTEKVTDKLENREKFEESDQMAKVEKIGQTDDLEKSERTNKSEKSDKTEKSDKSDRTEKSDGLEKSEKPEPKHQIEQQPSKRHRERPRTRGRKSGRVTRQSSKEIVQTSDSEEDQPLALRTESFLSSDINSSVSHVDFTTEQSSADSRRRSKRILQKEPLKEPAVVEKPDIVKVDSSKTMFDSSSDESFGIDVSELTAIVDMSLHTDNKSEQGGELSSTGKVDCFPRRRRRRTKKSPSSVMDDRLDDAASFTDESIISDISMTSSVLSGKKLPSLRMDSNEELLSNILIGLVPSKQPDKEKESSLVGGKGSDIELDDDMSPLLPDQVKKVSGRKKRKKFNWQLGIVSKKKRKKPSSQCSSASIASSAIDLDCCSINSETDATKDADLSPSRNKKAVSLAESSNANSEIKESPAELKDLPSKGKTLENEPKNVVEDTTLYASPEKPGLPKNKEVSLDKDKDQTEDLTDANKTKEEKEAAGEKTEAKDKETAEQDKALTDSTADLKADSKSDEMDLTEKALNDLTPEQLVEYAWSKQDRYKCLLCFFTGKNIVHHYKIYHVTKEVLISRLPPAEAQLAIEDAKKEEDNKTVDDKDSKAQSIDLEVEECKFKCRFCQFTVEGAMTVALETFYEHCSGHTGEYRFRCNSCTYQAVTKSSMRTHYYKACRKFNDSFYDAIIEENLDYVDKIEGFLCTNCNFVQLKESNLKKHVDFWHQNDSSVQIVKINMSMQLSNEEVEKVPPPAKTKTIEPRKSRMSQITPTAQDESTEKPNTSADAKSTTAVAEIEQKGGKRKTKEKDDGKETEVEKQKVSEKKSGRNETEGSLPTGKKLSAFVCPPELENKEVEIQLERKKRMQEIIKNIGIKLNKDPSSKEPSIIDKLKDKMGTNLQANEEAEEPTKSSLPDKFALSENSAAANNSAEESSSAKKTTDDDASSKAQEEEKEDSPCITDEIPVAEKSESKMIDPLKCTEKSGYESEIEVETSDNEMTRESAAAYESDSSSDQSDNEPAADVNMILKETSSIVSKDPMVTTIQRLAAQLQAAKPLESLKSVDSLPSLCNDPSDGDKSSDMSKIPAVVPIEQITELFAQDSSYQDAMSDMFDEKNSPKNFIRLRRLSGDMLSARDECAEDDQFVDVTSVDDSQSDVMGSTLQTDTEEECSFLKIENVVSLAPRADDRAESPIINDIRKAVETSPLKGKNISLLRKSSRPLILKRTKSSSSQPAQSTDVEAVPASSPEPIKVRPIKPKPPPKLAKPVTNIGFVPIAPKATTPSTLVPPLGTKLELPVPIIKKPILKPIVKPVATRPLIPIAPAPLHKNINYKTLKVIRTASTVLKPKDSGGQAVAVKLKSADAYAAMMKPSKLCQLYKCMGSDCRFTTDSVDCYQQHFNEHVSSVVNQKIGGESPYDYQKCAYCYMTLDDWNHMRQHMDEKHAHCRYQCNYCFYRAVAPSYVQIHQTLMHPGNQICVLLGKTMKDVPAKEDVNRHDYIQPYVCQHECGKFFYVPEAFASHLKTDHRKKIPPYKCHLCTVTCLKVDQLLSHYKIHGFYKFQCLYCLNGSDTFNDVHNHLSAYHCNRLPQVLERSLPVQPSKNSIVINQLLLRTVDDSLKSSNEAAHVMNDLETFDSKGISSSNIISLSKSMSASEDLAVIVAETSDGSTSGIPKLILPSANIVKGIVENGSTITIQGQEIAPIQTSILNRTLSELQLVPPSKSSGKSLSESLSNSDCDRMQQYIFHDTELELLTCSTDDLNAVDPLELTGGLECSDEFININLLDNPDVLKVGKDRSSPLFKNETAPTEADKADDSDIEILENIVETPKKPAEKEEVRTVTKPSEEQKIEKEDSTVPSSSDNGNSNDNFDVFPGKSTEKPLTLEDIKDTGFTGTELYKCGYEKCNFGAATPALLKTHVKECKLADEAKNLNCAHCTKRFVKIGFLLEHLKLHGIKRFGCSLCKMRCCAPYQATAHMKAKHKFFSSKLVPADPKNPSADGLFVVQPIRPAGERRGKKRRSGKGASDKESDKSGVGSEKLSFSPDEIDSLPRQAIYNREVQCAVCPYTTKVRTNIIRHLQLHAKDETVPETGPVNPVPCLDKKERMFDKMVNLASSSHQNGRMGGKAKEPVKEVDDGSLPKFVPEHKRYVCGVAECNYLTVDEAMLRYHLKALHSEEPYFRCPHCPPPLAGQEGQNIAIDKMGIHLKMHDTRLYKCSHCNHHHYHRHIVERHLTDKHPEKRPFVKVIRELESTENVQQPVQEEAEEDMPDPDGNHWKCNICDYKCVYKAEMASHAATAHDEKCQFKCTLCSFKTTGKILFEQHIIGKHSGDNADYDLVYQRIKGVNKKPAENTEQGQQEEPFDTTPLWRRDMPRVRHIRGILLEEEDEAPGSDSSAKPTKRKSDAEPTSVKPAKIKPGKSASLDENKQSKEKQKRSLSCEKICLEEESDKVAETSVDKATPGKKESTSVKEKVSKEGKTGNAVTVECDDSNNDADVGRFGPYGKPCGIMYVCTLCNQFKSKYKHDMRDHIYRELNYARWHCKECGFLSVNRNALLKHFVKHHPGERPAHAPLSPDNAIEEWVGTLLKRQTLMIKEHSLGLNNSQANSSSTSAPAAKGSNSASLPTTQKAKNAAGATTKTVDLTQSSKSPEKNSVEDVVDPPADDCDSGDHGQLVIDIKDDATERDINDSLADGEKSESSSKGDAEKSLTCKHCNMKFASWRGFKLHVQLTHLKRLGYLCLYCDRSTNSESLMRQHIRSKHPGSVEKIVHNPAAGGPELTSDFWEKEYGIVCPKKNSKKRKRKSNPDENEIADSESQDHPDFQGSCSICGFNAINLAGLKAHMRIHAKGLLVHVLMCGYCAFTASQKAEVWEHWKINHPHMPFKMQESNIKLPRNSPTAKKSIEDYSDDIEEESEIVTSVPTKDKISYSCFYCGLRSKSLDTVKRHWNLMHKCQKPNDPKSKPLPFRYKEIYRAQVSPQKARKIMAKSSPSTTQDLTYQIVSTSGTVSLPEGLMPSTSDSKREGWVCQWCNELCDSENNMKAHQNMFHSHLPVNFKKQEIEDTRRNYVCPECPFTTNFVHAMTKHVGKHINLFKCKYCEDTFATSAHVATHNSRKHVGLELKIESIQNYEALVEGMMARVTQTTVDDNMDTLDSELLKIATKLNIPKFNAVAKKSTARPTMRQSTHIISSKIKAVARKSTNPLPKYLPGINFRTDEAVGGTSEVKTQQISHYGLPRTPVNLAKLNTYMVVGGHRMKVNCTTLAQLINIDPKVVIKDLKHDLKLAAMLSKNK